MIELSSQRLASIEHEMDELGVREFYDEMIADGQSPNMAAMLAAQRPPATHNTDSDFVRKENSRMNSMGDEDLEKIVKIARRAGINTQGKTYNGNLGKYSNPDAWVSDTNDVKHAALRQGKNIDGAVKVNGYRGPKKKPIIAKDILDRLERNARKKDKVLDQKCRTKKSARTELREKLTAKHAYKKS